jgi:isopentenyl-diphosphate delta-isomerase
MSKDELLDLVNEDDEIIGEVWKSEAHRDPSKIHREVAIAVFNNRGEVLIQRRSMDKTNNPGSWKITAAGHVDKGENPKKAIERELVEELGIKVNVKYLTKRFEKREGKPGYSESRFVYVYYATVKGRAEIRLDKNEVMDARWIKPSKLEQFAKDNDWDLKGLSHKLILQMGEHLSNK